METLTKPGLRELTHRLRQSMATLSRLLDQTMSDIEMMELEFDEGESKSRARLTELVAERALLGQEIEDLKQAKTEWESERAQLAAEVCRANQALDLIKDAIHKR